MKHNIKLLQFCLAIIAVTQTGYVVTADGAEQQSNMVQLVSALNDSGDTTINEGSTTNWALRFDGINDVVNCGEIKKLDNSSALTIEMWVNIEKFNPWRTFFAKRVDDYNRIQFQEYSTPGDIGIAVSSSNIPGYYHTINSPITIGDWFHLAMVFDGTRKKDSDRLKVYINGREAALAPYKGEAVAAVTPVNTAPVLLGAEKDNGAYGYAGTMDEVRIWTVARTESQVIDDMRITAIKDTSGLVACYNFNDGAEKKIIDVVGNRNGTLKNFALSGSNSNWILRGYVKPTVAATTVTPSAVFAEKVQVGWKCGSGAYRVVFVKKGSDSLSVPNDLTTYKPGPFGSGSQVGTSGWYCVYNGPGSGTEITGLSVATGYVVHVVEYNGVPGKEQYLAIMSEGNPIKISTEQIEDRPLVQCANLHADSVNLSHVKLSWRKGDGAGRALFLTADTIASRPILKDKINYKATAEFGNGDSIGVWKCVYNGQDDKTVVTGLSPATRYRAILFEKNGIDVYTAWLNDTTEKNSTNFTTGSSPVVLKDIDIKPEVHPVVTEQKTPQIKTVSRKKQKLIVIIASGLTGVLATGVASAIVYNNNHSSDGSPESHDLGVPPIAP